MNYRAVIKKIIVSVSAVSLETSFPCLSFCQSVYRFENITNEQGIADRIVNAIAQDAQGFIWVASIDGLTRYDGYNAILYRHQTNDPHSLSDNEVYALCTDGSGVLWIGTRNGLSRYDARNDRFENFLHNETDKNSLAANEIFALAKDARGDLWIGTYNGGLDKLVKTAAVKGSKDSAYSFIHYRHNERDSNTISNDQVFSVSFDKAGRAWVGTTWGVNLIEKDGKKISRIYADPKNKNSITNNAAYKIIAANDGTVWLCGQSMLDNVSIRETGFGKKIISVRHYLPQLVNKGDPTEWAIDDFMIDRFNNYWVGTNDQGVIKFRLDEEENIGSKENFVSGQSVFSLVNSTVFSFYEDKAGVIWIGTAKGISKYIPSKARFNEKGFSESSFGLNGQPVNALLYDSKGRLWLGSDDDTLVVLDGTENSVPLPLSRSHFNQVNMLYESRTGDIYVATFTDGLFIIPNNVKNVYDTRQWIHINKIYSQKPGDNVYTVAEDKNGIIWLGTYTGLSSYDPRTKKINNVYVSPGGTVVSGYILRALFIDEENVKWCGTDEGLVLIKDKAVQKFISNDKDSNSLSNNRVTVIYGDKNKNIWVGTKSGLNLFDSLRNNFKHFTDPGSSTIETIMSIRDDKKGDLWLGTNNGLVKFATAEKKFTKYTVGDGLCSNEFEPNASCSDDGNNTFYFGTSNGIVSFTAAHIVSNNFVPPVVITDVKILDVPLASWSDTAIIHTYRREKKLLLKYDENFFSFQFASLSYNNPQANQYAYILEGVDRQWHQAGTQHFAGYTDIRPGHYTFKVKGSNNDGIWNNEPVIIKVIIAPPWWKTWWFYTLCFLAACAIVYVIYRIRIQQILKTYKLRSSIAKDLHDDVGSALSSIALLSNISREAQTKARLEPEQIFSRIGDTSKRMIDLMDDIVWSVNPDNDRFSNMLVRMREYAAEMLESKDIAFNFQVADEIDELRIPMQMRKDYFLIFKEAVNNLAKYSECSKAAISIKKENKNIVTTVNDNGKGFDAGAVNSGNGVKNMYERAAAIKAKLYIETVQGNGTTVSLSMPV